MSCFIDGQEVVRMRDQCVIREVMPWSPDYEEWGFSHVLAARLQKVDTVPDIIEVPQDQRIVCDF